MDSEVPEDKGQLARRTVLVAGGVVVTAVGVAGALSVNASAQERGGPHPPKGTPPASGEACYTLTSELTEGPYYIDADKIRRDVTEDQEGIPLTLDLKVIDADTCRPLRNAAVDIWHCNATGIYSGYEASSGGGGGPAPTGAPPSGTPTGTPTGGPPPGGGGGHQEPTDADRFLRGTWHTDRHGQVTFKTVFPGWYQGRCVHIHVKVHVDGEWTDAGYEGGHTCFTGQLFFDEKSVLASALVEPYVSNTTTRTTLTEDGIYPQNGHEGGLLYLKYDKRHIGRGVHGHLTLGVTPDETNDGEGGGGGPAPSASASASPSATTG
ncbi:MULTISPECIES: intradiol ring-cleavage dioxygenase [unclassified Streptomyces]|uniref:intradiol ring-cleavage dioxygenase n=1 Tax=unclassified Streptomyces TaxID=2593676 RepID=UPI0019095963|nr:MULTISPECIES: intradiol ring-cleavage dioxygenase [unclassified Streptomyces]MBK3569898.1 intradiol ring-cleavage dioxygenase [Streptomyces sp. MBT62]MBK6015701.1 intradiol ring-cleavage dioxygenase [Streptomyces sp. MBT53]